MTILITGGSKGIGRGIAERFATPGNTVLINYAHSDDAARETADAVNAKGATAVLLKRDMADADACFALLDDAKQHTDHIDQLVHCAVLPVSKPALDLLPEDFERAVRVNGSNVLWLTQAALPLMGRGSTVFLMSSRGSKVVVPNYASIGAPKALGEALLRYLAVELAPLGIRTHVVSSSGVLTDAFRAAVPNAEERFAAAAASNPSGRNLEIDDIASAVEWLSSPGAEMITGREIFIDGGLYIKT
jgi:enoyl-[acyl-carrier protein] reductase III